MSPPKNEESLHGGLQEQIEEYVVALQEGDLDRLLALFEPKAKIVSPLEGTKDPKTFYKHLLDVTQDSSIRLVQHFIGGSGWAAAYLKYDWTLTDGTRTRFEVMDLFRFGDDGRIKELKVFYDPARIRPAYEAIGNG